MRNEEVVVARGLGENEGDGGVVVEQMGTFTAGEDVGKIPGLGKIVEEAAVKGYRERVERWVRDVVGERLAAV